MKPFALRHELLWIRPLTPADRVWMKRWLNDPNVLAYYEGRDKPHTDAMIDRFLRKTGNPVCGCLIIWDNQPVGYLQVYPIAKSELEAYGLDPSPGVFGLDLFIGETLRWGQGIGTSVVHHVSSYLFGHDAQRILIDPRINNPRAVHVYEKCGFVILKRLSEHELHEGVREDCWLMEKRP